MSFNPADDVFARNLLLTRVVSPEQVEDARAEQSRLAGLGIYLSLGEALVKQGLITEAIRANVEKMAHGAAAVGLQSLGQFKLLKKLGEGGMGAVYLAEDTVVGRKVALKVLPRRLATDGEFLTRFKREAKATGRLNHENVVSAYTIGEELGFHYYVMEYCEGEPLDKLLKRERFLVWDKAIGIAIQIARGLRHAHQTGIVHRDIKPANIFLTMTGTIKILDMGLSKNILDTEASFNTRTGMTLGTPHYIAPEQARGDKGVDGRADIYSLGATLYNLVTGETPFQGSSPAVIMMKHLNEKLANPQDIREDIPDGVALVIQKMMAKEPDDRYQTCEELLADLELLMLGKTPDIKLLDDVKSSISARKAGRAPAHPVPVAQGSDQRSFDSDATTPLYTPLHLSKASIAWLAGAAMLLISVSIYFLTRPKDKTPVPGRVIASADSLKPAATTTISTATAPPTPPTDPAPAVEVPAVTDAWVKSVQGLPAPEQLEKVAGMLQKLNPKWDGKYESKVEDNQVISLLLVSDKLQDISPVRALAGLRTFSCEGIYSPTGAHSRNQVTDLSPIKDLPISRLKISLSGVTNLAALERMQLEELYIVESFVDDLEPIKDAPLKFLHCMGSRVASLAPLAKNTTLEVLSIHATPIRDLTPLSGKPLHVLVASRTQIESLRPLVGLPLDRLEIGETKIADLSPLKEISTLRALNVDRKPSKDVVALLLELTQVRKINELYPAEFYAAHVPAGSPLLIYEDFEKFEPSKLPAGWNFEGQVTMEEYAGHGRVLRVERRKSAARVVGLKIDLEIERLRGRKLLASVSAICPKGYERNLDASSAQPSLAVITVDKDGRRKETGMGVWSDETGWKKLGYANLIPRDAQKVELWLRVTDVTAEAFFDDLKIETLPEKSDELLAYEDFDEFDLGRLPPGWNLSGGEYFSTVEHAGRGRVLRMTHDGDNAKPATLTVALPVQRTQDRVVRASFLASCPKGYAQAEVGWHMPRGLLRWDKSDGTRPEKNVYIVREPSAWKLYSIEKEIPASAKNVVFYLQCFHPADVLFDDIKVELLPRFTDSNVKGGSIPEKANP